jgi:hypothetical protein
MQKSVLYYLGIIEGVAQARGEDAYPVVFWHALKMLSEALEIPNIIPAAEKPLEKPTQEAVILPPITQRALEKAASAASEKPKRQWSPEARARAAQRIEDRLLAKGQQTDGEKIRSFLATNGKTTLPTHYANGSASSVVIQS